MAKIKNGSEVLVIAGQYRGKKGKVEKVFTNGRVEVSGVGEVKKCVKAAPQNPNGGIVGINPRIHISNLEVA